MSRRECQFVGELNEVERIEYEYGMIERGYKLDFPL